MKRALSVLATATSIVVLAAAAGCCCCPPLYVPDVPDDTSFSLKHDLGPEIAAPSMQGARAMAR